MPIAAHPRFFFDVVPDAGLRVAKLGNSSVVYEVGIFRGVNQAASDSNSDESHDQEQQQLAVAQGSFVHVFVDKATQKPVTIPEPIRQMLAAVASPAQSKL